MPSRPSSPADPADPVPTAVTQPPTPERTDAAARPSLLTRLREAGITPEDDDDTRLAKSLLIFATGLVSIASALWLALYWRMGPQVSSTLPFAYQVLLAANLFAYLKSGRFERFRVIQLALFLFFPFVMQWAIGNIVAGSGLVLWGLLAPVGALLCLGTGPAGAWFAAYLFMLALTGYFDYALGPFATYQRTQIPLETVVVFFTLNIAAVSTIVFLLLRFAFREKARARARLRAAHAQLRVEQARSEMLLLNILPGPVADRLKRNDQTIADGFADVTVMFADIVNFTQVAAGMTPVQVFTMLNRVFSHFDELAESLKLEKIKTIGDAYMAAGGIPDENQTHSVDAVLCALRFQKLMKRHSTASEPARNWRLRVGIHCGPVITGVVGTDKFVYDVWGDTVNTASRMEAAGMPGEVNISKDMYERVKHFFICEGRGLLPVKGKGDMEMFLVRGIRPELEDRPNHPNAEFKALYARLKGL